MYVYRDETVEYGYGENIVVLLDDDEAQRLAALLNQHELSGGKPPGSTLYTALRNEGVKPDYWADRYARRGRPIAIVSDQHERYWDTPNGQDHLAAFYRGERWQ
jgi:hypothetical protein